MAQFVAVTLLVFCTAPHSLAQQGQTVPTWDGKEDKSSRGNPHVDEARHQWGVYTYGPKSRATTPEAWKPLQWNMDAFRWEGAKLRDRAPTYSAEGVLRGRPHTGRNVGLIFQPASPAVVSLVGNAFVKTWSPDGHIRILVQKFGPDDRAETLYDEIHPNRTAVDWTQASSLQALQLGEGEKLALTFISERGGTAFMKLRPDGVAPTSIVVE